MALATAANAQYAFGYSYGYPGDVTLTVGFADSTSVSLGAQDTGWWSNYAGNDSENKNYYASTGSSEGFNDFFAFDTSGLDSSAVTSLSLEVESYVISGDATYQVWDVSTAESDLENNNGTSSAIYDDLGSGKNYGSYDLSTNVSYTLLTFDLNANAIADFSADESNGFFATGGTYGAAVSSTPGPESAVVMGIAALGVLRRKKSERLNLGPSLYDAL